MIGRPFVVDLTPGNVADVTAAPKLIERAAGLGYLIGDKGYDADGLRAMIRARGGRPVIPGKANRKRKIPLDKARYKSPSDRECFRPIEGFQTYRHSLRQAGPKLLVRRRPRNFACLLDLIESGA
ncbi:IS5 family transposase [Inquilinus ginsengisoli]